MKRFIIIFSIILGAAFVAAFLYRGHLLHGLVRGNDIRQGTIQVKNAHEADLPGMAKIRVSEAIKTAIHRKNGRVLKVELENENGFLMYSVEVVAPAKKIFEIMIDAGNGKVVKIERDKKDADDHNGSDDD